MYNGKALHLQAGYLQAILGLLFHPSCQFHLERPVELRSKMIYYWRIIKYKEQNDY